VKKLRLDDRGFASAEFIFITLIVLIVIAGFAGLISSSQEKTDTGNLGEARIIGEKIAEAINTAYVHGDGYSVNLTVPPTPEITASVNKPPNYVTVFYNGQNISVKLIPKNVQTIDLSSNHVYTVTNTNGIITIQQIT
jgi:hypothetical protein